MPSLQRASSVSSLIPFSLPLPLLTKSAPKLRQRRREYRGKGKKKEKKEKVSLFFAFYAAVLNVNQINFIHISSCRSPSQRVLVKTGDWSLLESSPTHTPRRTTSSAGAAVFRIQTFLWRNSNGLNHSASCMEFRGGYKMNTAFKSIEFTISSDSDMGNPDQEHLEVHLQHKRDFIHTNQSPFFHEHFPTVFFMPYN